MEGNLLLEPGTKAHCSVPALPSSQASLWTLSMDLILREAFLLINLCLSSWLQAITMMFQLDTHISHMDLLLSPVLFFLVSISFV